MVTDKIVLDRWIPKLKTKLGDKSKRVTESRLMNVAKMCQSRKVYESAGYATLGSVPGRGSYSLGNNPANGLGDYYDSSKRGSAEVFQNLFGVFVEVASFNVGMELLPLIPMTKSSGTIYIAEPIYADGRIDSAANKPTIIQVKMAKNGAAPALVIGTKYTVKTANSGGENVMELTFVGLHRISANTYLFKVGQQFDNSGSAGTNWQTAVISECLDSATNDAGIYTNGTDYWSFDGGVDYASGFVNYINGYSGAGRTDTDNWFNGRGNGKNYGKPMSRQTGETTYYRSMGVRTWSHNFAAETVHVDIEYTTEQIQDMQMDHGLNALEFGESIMQDQLNQHINEHILGTMFAMGWQHHYDMFARNGFNMNAYISASNTTGTAQSFLGKDGETLLTISGAAGVLPATGAISENLSSLQRRVVTRLLYGSGVINNRSRRGRGDQSVMNTTFTTAVKDIRGFQPAPFENDLNDSGLYMCGSLYGIKIYEDPLMELTDERINISRHGNEKDPGLKMCPYILAEKISTIAEGTMSPKEALKSRYSLVPAGSIPETNYLTFTVEQGAGYKLV